MKVCIVGASGKLGQYMVQQSLDRGYEVVGVCREQSVQKLDAFKGRITVIPGATDDREVIERAVAGCDGVLVVMTPRGVHGARRERPRAPHEKEDAGFTDAQQNRPSEQAARAKAYPRLYLASQYA